MKKRIGITYRGKRLDLLVEDCNLLQKFVGLMFSDPNKIGNLLFSFKRKQKIAIHSFFVFYPFLAIWLDKHNSVVEIKKVLPFSPCVIPKKLTFKLIEIPINSENNHILNFFL